MMFFFNATVFGFSGLNGGQKSKGVAFWNNHLIQKEYLLWTGGALKKDTQGLICCFYYIKNVR